MLYQAMLNYLINFDHILIILIFIVELFLYEDHQMLVIFVFLTYYFVQLKFLFVFIFHFFLLIMFKHFDSFFILIYLLMILLMVVIYGLFLHHDLYVYLSLRQIIYHGLHIMDIYINIYNQNKNTIFIIISAMYMFFLMISLEKHPTNQLLVYSNLLY